MNASTTSLKRPVPVTILTGFLGAGKTKVADVSGG